MTFSKRTEPSGTSMDLTSILTVNKIDSRNVLVLRHRPHEPQLRKVLPWLAAEKPHVFNAYQQTQTEKVENAMLGMKYVASFIGHEASKALFVGIYSVGKSRRMTYSQYWKVPAYVELKEFGMEGFTGKHRSSLLWFWQRIGVVILVLGLWDCRLCRH